MEKTTLKNPKTIGEKIIESHLVTGTMIKGEEIGIRIDQTLTQDATGTMAYLEFESMGIDRVRTEKSVAYIDHNTIQSGFENADDHRYIQSVAKKHGIYFSEPGNGICHQVHYERFGKPGKTLIGSDSHTPTAGAVGMLAMGAGGMDVAVAMAGGAYYINMPGTILVKLKGKLRKGVSAKDIILEVLRILTVKGGVGKIIEYGGSGIKNLSIPERATITNMGAELGATTSIFPSDEITKEFLKLEKREKDWKELKSDENANYERIIEIDLDTLEPLIACPHSPDNVKKVSEIKGLKIDQVVIGSCTNSSLMDMEKVAGILGGKKISDNVSLGIATGSKQVLNMIAKSGAFNKLINAGARILECACGPCIGMGFSPNSKGVSLRTFNRNFLGRSGTRDAEIYLASPEVAAISALYGEIRNPLEENIDIEVKMPREILINDDGIIPPSDLKDFNNQIILRGPNIKPFPKTKPLIEKLKCKILLKVSDNITTDHIMPAGSRVLPYRSNIPKISEYCFEGVDKSFCARAKKAGNGVIVGGVNYGQGSSREHAALAPMYLGIKAVVAKSFARIHRSNLINAGILPLTFENDGDYEKINEGDEIEILNIHESVETGKFIMKVNGIEISLQSELTPRQKAILLSGGLLNYTKNLGENN